MPALVPRPTEATLRPGHFALDDDTELHLGPGAEPAADLLRTLLAPATGLPLRPSPDGQFTLTLDSGLGHLGEEGYVLTIDPHAVSLRAAHPTGLLRGIQTIRQLLPPRALSATPQRGTPWLLPCADITDVPRHPWRGAMLDVARHFQPVSYLRRYVDVLALHKISVFHLHLTDDQGWRMPVAAYPKLTEIGGHRAESQQVYGAPRTTASRTAGRTRGPNSATLSGTRPLAVSPSCPRSRCPDMYEPPSPPIPTWATTPSAPSTSGPAGACATPCSASTTRSSTSAAPSSTR